MLRTEQGHSRNRTLGGLGRTEGRAVGFRGAEGSSWHTGAEWRTEEAERKEQELESQGLGRGRGTDT